MKIDLFRTCIEGLKTAQHSPIRSSSSHCISESVIGRYGRYRLEVAKVRGKPTLRYVPEGPPAPSMSGLSDMRVPIHEGGRLVLLVWIQFRGPATKEPE